MYVFLFVFYDFIQLHDVVETGCRALMLTFGDVSLPKAHRAASRLRVLAREMIRGSIERLLSATINAVAYVIHIFSDISFFFLYFFF